jgi:2-Cys peroxiredoxin 5
VENEDALKAAGVDEVMIYCVNDGAVMTAWGKDQKVEEGSIIKMYGDPTSAFTKACDMELTHEGPIGVGLLGRCKRFALYVVDGEIKFATVAESDFDPAGDDFPEKVLAPALLEAIKETR